MTERSRSTGRRTQQHDRDTRAAAIAATIATDSSERASTLTLVPASTSRTWYREYRSMDDRALDAMVADNLRALRGVLSDLLAEATVLALEMRAAGNARGMQAAVTTIAILVDKLAVLGPTRRSTIDVTPAEVATYHEFAASRAGGDVATLSNSDADVDPSIGATADPDVGADVDPDPDVDPDVDPASHVT